MKDIQVSNIIAIELKKQGRTRKWLAEQLELSEKVLSYRFKNNTFTAVELLNVFELLNIDLNKFKEEF